jgi:outer membrane lipoprotein carrier protein
MTSTTFTALCHRLLTAACGLLALTLAPHAAAQDDAAAARLAAILAKTTSLSAEVEQLVLDQDGREVQETQVLLEMRKPASFRWEVREPWEELTVTDGDLIWRHEPDLEQVTIRRFDDALDRTPAMLLNADAATIAETYEVTAASGEGGGLTRFILHPRQPDSLFERLSLTFSGDELLDMHIEDSLGQRTSLAFRSLQRNLSLPDARFRFEIPPGVDVIDTVGISGRN